MSLKITSFALLFAFVCVEAQVPMDLLGFLPYSQETSDVWGFEKNGSEYAIATTFTGTSFVDVTDPTNPVELFFVSGPNSSWRDAKDFNQDYVYVINESSGGLQVFDLTNFPASLSDSYWTGGTFNGQNVPLGDSHNVFVDENGYCYVIGFTNNVQVPGVMILDLNVDPVNPPIVGMYDNGYVHDIFVRGDTMWTAEYNNGYFAVVDVSDKANWNIMAIQSTPSNATHNIWVSDDGNYAFTTDETGGGTIASFDVSDLTDIQLLDEYASSHPTPSIPHNSFVRGNYLISSHYRDGVTAVDISNPYNLTEVAHYDTSPNYQGQGYNGCWGVYPYLPSGNILATDIEMGLYILGEAEEQPAPTFSVSLKVILEGAYIGNGMMSNVLVSDGLLPLQHPYGVAPYNNATVNTITSLPVNAVDWVLVEARSGTPATMGPRATVTEDTKVGLLLTDGTIVQEDGVSPLVFENLNVGDEYYFCVRHRNHLDVLTATSITGDGANVMSFDFTTDISQARGAFQQVVTSDGYAAIHAGEYTQDGTIQITDYDQWQTQPALLDVYLKADGNLDGVIQTSDYDVWFPNKAKIAITETDF